MKDNDYYPKKQIKRELIEEHLKSPEPECRWCFAIDSVRVKGKIKKLVEFDDALVEHLSCPRCGGEFTRYNEGFIGEYLKERILKLHPELSESLDMKTIESVAHKAFPEYLK